MKLGRLLMAVLGLSFVTISCSETEEDLGAPAINLASGTVELEAAGGSASAEITATRDWVASADADWIVVDPVSGKGSSKAQKITVTVLENTGADRTGSVKFDIGFDSKTLTVAQKGPLGDAKAAILYSNDFDKEVATQTFGSGTSWPYLDQFEGWKNQTGSGVENVEYVFNGISCRANSASNGSYSDYTGSGSNNLLFSSSPYLIVKNIALGGAQNIKISFGTERYAYGETDNTFKPEEFLVYVSNDAAKWVNVAYTFPNGFKNGRWDQASGVITVPAGTETLHVYFKSTLSGGHRLDDVKLETVGEAGAAIDFSAGIELPTDGTTGGGGGTVTPPANITDATVAEFKAAAVSTEVYYRLKGTVGSGTVNTTYGNFDIKDATDSVYVYGISNISSYSAIKTGDQVTVVGTRGEYNGKIEMLNGYIEAYTAGQGGGSSDTGNTGTAEGAGTEASPYNVAGVLQHIAKLASGAVDTVFVKGKVTSITEVSTSYGNAKYYISDDASASNKFLVYNCYYIGGEKYVSADQLQVGDDVVLRGPVTNYNGSTPEMTNGGKIVSLNGSTTGRSYFSLSTTYLSVSSKAGTATIKVVSNVDWTVASDNSDFAVSPASGSGDGEITVTYPENATGAVKSGKITVSTTASVAKASYEVAVSQSKPANGTEVTSKFVMKDLGVTNATAAPAFSFKDAEGAVIVNAAFNKGAGSNTPLYYDLGEAVRMYKSNTLTFTPATGVTITKVVINGTTSYMGNTDAGFSSGNYVVSGATGTWTGEATAALVYNDGSASNTQTRIVSIEITCVK